MSRIITLIQSTGFLALFALCHTIALSQNTPVIVKDIEFDFVDSGVKDDEHLRIAVELTGGTNSDANAVNSRFVDDIEVKVVLAFEVGPKKYECFESKAEIVTLETGEDVIVRFYMAPEIIERQQLPREPFAYLAEISVAGEQLPMSKDAVSNLLANPERLSSFNTHVRSGSSKNEGLLVPIYDSLFWTGINPREFQDMPAYKRKPSN